MVDRYEVDGELNQQQQQILVQPHKSKVAADARKSPNIWATGVA
jgi:hypothetical protein